MSDFGDLGLLLPMIEDGSSKLSAVPQLAFLVFVASWRSTQLAIIGGYVLVTLSRKYLHSGKQIC